MLTLAISPDLERRLEEEAAKRGLQAPEYALRLLATSLATQDDDLDILLDEAMGAFAHVSFSTEDLHRERREDLEREERRWQERFGKKDRL